MLTRRRRRPPTTILALAALAAACEPGTAPDLDAVLDTDAALADYDAVESLFASPDWEGFRALGGRTPFSSSAAAVEAVAALDAVGTAGGGRSFAVELSSRLASLAARSGAPAAAPIISETHRGATFVYDPDTDQYVDDPDREGAPATGVRFVLYEVDDAGLPLVDEEVGHADLVDEGDSSAEDVALRLVVVVHGRTALDYSTTLDIGLLWAEVTVLGFLEGEDGVRLDFDIGARGTQSLAGGTVDVTLDLGVESRGFSITGTVSGIEEGGEGAGEVQLTVRHGQHTIEADLTGTAGQIDGSILLNGELFATVSGDAESPTILSADGDPLTLEEQLVLHRVLDTIEDVFDFLEDLVDPVDEILLAGIIL
jgi:hypothetical protein